jgi:hypothetical protein
VSDSENLSDAPLVPWESFSEEGDSATLYLDGARVTATLNRDAWALFLWGLCWLRVSKAGEDISLRHDDSRRTEAEPGRIVEYLEIMVIDDASGSGNEAYGGPQRITEDPPDGPPNGRVYRVDLYITRSEVREAYRTAQVWDGEGELRLLDQLLTIRLTCGVAARWSEVAALTSAVRDPRLDQAQVLLAALNSSDVIVRREARRYLAEVPTPTVFTSLCHTLKEGVEDDARWEAAEALGEMGDPAAIPALLASLTDPCEMVRLCVAEALGLCGRSDPRVPAALCCLLTDFDDGVRIFTLEALGDLGDATVLPAVRSRRECEPPAVRVWVYYALAQLGDEPFALTETLEVLRQGNMEERTQAAKVLAYMATPETAPRILRALETAHAREESAGMRECIGTWRDEVRRVVPTNRGVA